MTTAKAVRASSGIDATTYYNFTFTTNDTVPSGGYFRVILPTDQVTVPSGGPTSCSIDGTSGTFACSITFSSTSFI